MTDYTVSVGFRGDMSGLTPDVTRGTAAIDKLGTEASKTSGSTAALSRATDALSLAVKSQTAAAIRASEAEGKLNALRRAGITGTKEEAAALERYVITQNRLIASSAKVEAAQRRSMTLGAEAARVQATQAKTSGLGLGGLTKTGLTGIAGYEVGKFAIDSVSQLQKAQISLSALLGGNGPANDMITQLQAFARQTPFNFTQLLGMTQQIIAMGTAGKDVMPTITALADTVGSMGGSNDQLANLALTLSQIKNSGHVNAQDLRQLVESGHIDPFKILADANNMTRAQVAEQVNKGTFKLDGELAAQQILDGLEARFHGGAQRASATLGGQISNLYDNAQQAAAKTLKPFLPELTISVKALGDSLGFITQHDTARHLAEVAGAAIAGQKALSWAQGKLAGDAAKTIATNEAVATSYRQVGTAAATAAGEVAALDVAEAGGGAGGFRAKAGTVARNAGGLLPFGAIPTIIGAGVVVSAEEVMANREVAKTLAAQKAAAREAGRAAMIKQAAAYGVTQGAKPGEFVTELHTEHSKLFGFIPISKTVGYDQANAGMDLLGSLPAKEPAARPMGAAYMAAQVTAARAAARDAAARSALTAARSAVVDPSKIPQTPLFDAPPAAADPAKLQDARDRLANAQQRLRNALGGGGGGGGPKRSTLLSAQASLAGARAAQSRKGGDPTAEALRVQAAEARLNEVRGSGTRSASSTATAEGKVATARRAVDKATRDLHKVEKTVAADGSISLKDIMDRATRTARTGKSEVAGVRQLVKAGLSKPVIDELMALEKTAPGTIANVAKGMTSAYVKQLNADEAARSKAQTDLASLSKQAGVHDALAAAATSGRQLAKATTDAYNAALKDPAWVALAKSALAGILLPGGTNPVAPGAKAQPRGGGAGSASLADTLFGPLPSIPAQKPRGVTVPAPLVAPPPVVASGGHSRVNAASLQRLHPDDLAVLKEIGPITVHAETGATGKDISNEVGWELGKRRLG